MKKIFLSFIILSSLVYGQSGLPSLLSDDNEYDVDAKTYFNTLTTPLSPTRKDTINTFVVMLKDSLGISNLSDFFDVFYLLANTTEESVQKNLANPLSFTITKQGTPTFAVDKGYTFAGATTYLITNYTPKTQAIRFLLNSATMGTVIATNTSTTSTDFSLGTSMTQAGAQIRYSGVTYAALNNANGQYIQVNESTSIGHYILTRTASNVIILYKNKAELIAGTLVSTSIQNAAMAIIGTSTNRQVRAFFVSAGCDAIQQRKITNCIEWYLDSIGAGVIP